MADFILDNTTTTSDVFYSKGGALLCLASGTWAGATLTLEVKKNNTAWITLDDFAITKDDALNVYLKGVLEFRFSLLNAGASTNINVSFND